MRVGADPGEGASRSVSFHFLWHRDGGIFFTQRFHLNLKGLGLGLRRARLNLKKILGSGKFLLMYGGEPC